jgi:DNA-binding NtrC family response regulator
MNQISLLFVDNDRELLDTAARFFLQKGHHITAVHHPRQALSVASRNPFDAVVVGATLPETDGLDLMQLLRGVLGDIPFLMLSNKIDIDLQREAIERGVYRFLVKPVAMSQLESIICDAQARRPGALCSDAACAF